ncbi:hypothetical protein MKW94_021713 [Papaver nudicaule]|uniref:F-box domain-containing protein n=1 Tax=Papaver nudicaule TaxID=74823 RepID=A0AA41W0I2_PAPNU|nr:hypothetical protein [Papaver nudicaule]
MEVQKKKSGHIKNLPDDILLDILSRLPVESVLDCKLVCKKLQKLLHDRRSFFANMHASRQLNQLYGKGADKLDTSLLFGCTTGDTWHVSLFYGGLYNDKINTDGKYEFKKTLKKVRHPPMHHDLPQQYMVGSCNGLVCLGRNHHHRVDPIYIYNPVTGEYINLPKLIIPKESTYPRIARGFGYVSSTNEYKVVRIFYPGHDTTGQVQVYTLGSGCGWRTKSTSFPRVNLDVPASFVDGSLYWFYRSDVYAYDLAKEEMRTVPSPSPCHIYALGSSINDKFDLVVLRGKLCFFHQTLKAPDMEIWSLKKTDMNESWCKDFCIVNEKEKRGARADCFWPLTITKNGEIIFTKENETIHCYDPKTTTWKEIVAEDPDFDLASIWVNSHVNTFVSLKTLGKKSSCRTKMMGRLDVVRELSLMFESQY